MGKLKLELQTRSVRQRESHVDGECLTIGLVFPFDIRSGFTLRTAFKKLDSHDIHQTLFGKLIRVPFVVDLAGLESPVFMYLRGFSFGESARCETAHTKLRTF